MDILDRLEAERACSALSRALAYHLDRRDHVAVAQLFVSDGVYISHETRLQGADQIIAALDARPANLVMRHVTASIHFTTIEPDLARAVVVNISYFSPGTTDIPATLAGDRVMVIDFEDTYTKTDDGWRILERNTRPILLPDYMRPILLPITYGPKNGEH